MTSLKAKQYVFVSCLIFFFSSVSLSAQDFEGTIYYEIPELKKEGMGELPYMIKDSKVRMEFGEGDQKGAMLFLPDESRMVVIIEAMKGFMTMDLDEAPAQSDNEEIPDMKKTGEIKTIAGRSCEVWESTSEDEIYEVCVARGMGNFMMPENPMGNSSAPGWAEDITNGGFMPLEVTEVKGSQKTVQLRALRIEEKSLDASLFEIPKGYNDMSSMMQQMMQQNE